MIDSICLILLYVPSWMFCFHTWCLLSDVEIDCIKFLFTLHAIPCHMSSFNPGYPAATICLQFVVQSREALINLTLIFFSAFHEKYICETETSTVSCNETACSTLNIIYANYGRTSIKKCKHIKGNSTDCRSASSTTMVRETCQQKVICTLEANNSIFGDPCSSVAKYWKFTSNVLVRINAMVLRDDSDNLP